VPSTRDRLAELRSASDAAIQNGGVPDRLVCAVALLKIFEEDPTFLGTHAYGRVVITILKTVGRLIRSIDDASGDFRILLATRKRNAEPVFQLGPKIVGNPGEFTWISVLRIAETTLSTFLQVDMSAPAPEPVHLIGSRILEKEEESSSYDSQSDDLEPAVLPDAVLSQRDSYDTGSDRIQIDDVPSERVTTVRVSHSDRLLNDILQPFFDHESKELAAMVLRVMHGIRCAAYAISNLGYDDIAKPHLLRTGRCFATIGKARVRFRALSALRYGPSR